MAPSGNEVQVIVHLVDRNTGEREVCQRTLSDVEVIHLIERASKHLREKYDRVR